MIRAYDCNKAIALAYWVLKVFLNSINLTGKSLKISLTIT